MPCDMDFSMYYSLFIIYLEVIMQNLHSVILVTSQLPISARRAKKKCISISACVQTMHINDVTMKMYVTTKNYFRILSSFVNYGKFTLIVYDK